MMKMSLFFMRQLPINILCFAMLYRRMEKTIKEDEYALLFLYV